MLVQQLFVSEYGVAVTLVTLQSLFPMLTSHVFKHCLPGHDLSTLCAHYLFTSPSHALMNIVDVGFETRS